MKVVNIERVIISAEELATLEKAKDILQKAGKYNPDEKD